MAIPRVLIEPLRPWVRAAVRAATDRWPPRSRLFIVHDSPRWVLAEERRALRRIAARLGVPSPDPRLAAWSRGQCLFYLNHFGVLGGAFPALDHRIAVAYYHGLPGSGNAVFDACFQRLYDVHPRIDRLVVTHEAMRRQVLQTGIDPGKVHLIPLGIDLRHFRLPSPDERRRMRQHLGIPLDARVVGSFQKDGVGWGDGMEPKLVKGPDVFLRVIERLRGRVPNLWVLLTGPARGYVRAGLERLGVPYRHRLARGPAEVGRMYHALDAYLIASRQEGGPKAALEAMASGVPLVTTRVGQAADLVRHGETGWVAEVEDDEGLARWLEAVLTAPEALQPVLARARAVAEANAYDAQLPLWRRFFDGFVRLPIRE